MIGEGSGLTFSIDSHISIPVRFNWRIVEMREIVIGVTEGNPVFDEGCARSDLTKTQLGLCLAAYVANFPSAPVFAKVPILRVGLKEVCIVFVSSKWL